MAERTRAYLGLGSNLGDRRGTIESALAALEAHPEIAVLSVSRLIETAPQGPPGQGPYLNGAAAIDTALSPRGLLEALQAIEAAHGRDRAREVRWGPRTLDLDLLLYGDIVLDQGDLTVPHPRMHERAFVLAPLAEIAPHAVHPVLRQTSASLYATLRASTTPR